MKTIIASIIVACPLSSYAASVAFDFSSASQYNSNFVESLNPETLTHNAANSNILYTAISANRTGAAVYDTLPTNGLRDNADFLTETISADFSFGSVSSGDRSAGLYARVQANNTGVLGLMNTLNSGGSSIRLRLFHGASITSTAAGTSFYDATFNLTTGAFTNAVGTGGTGSMNTYNTSPLNLVLTQTSAADLVFSVSVSDGQGLIASSGEVTLTSAISDNYDGAGAIGFRVNGPSNNQTITIDNFTAVPEPSAAVIGALGALALLRRRR